MLARDLAETSIVFDPGHEYGKSAFTCETDFLSAVNAGAGLLVLRPPFDPDVRARMFARFCAVGLAIARARGRCLVVIDELHLVTESGRAPGSWRELIETGRKFGVSIIASSIRPAAIDKSFWTNCTHVRSGRLNFGDDQKTLSNCLGVDQADIARLTGYEFIARNLLTGETSRG